MVLPRDAINTMDYDPILDDDETGTWGMGTGWEFGLYALETYLRGELPDISPADFEAMPEFAALAHRFGEAWAAAVESADAAGSDRAASPGGDSDVR